MTCSILRQRMGDDDPLRAPPYANTWGVTRYVLCPAPMCGQQPANLRSPLPMHHDDCHSLCRIVTRPVFSFSFLDYWQVTLTWSPYGDASLIRSLSIGDTSTTYYTDVAIESR